MLHSLKVLICHEMSSKKLMFVNIGSYSGEPHR